MTSPSGTSGINTADSARIIFWEELNKLCGYAYQGVVVAGAENDTFFRNRELIMLLRSCDPGKVRIPFFSVRFDLIQPVPQSGGSFVWAD